MDTNKSVGHIFNNQLVLYYHSHSFYSQKVLFVLYEKNIKFSLHEIDVTNGEQYSKWFLELNPKAEVPVLQDGQLVIPESARIISYLEDNFRTENISRLIPQWIDKHTYGKIITYHRTISRLPIGAVSMGSFIHTDLCPNPKPPFIGIVRYSFLQTDERLSNILKEYTKINPEHADILLNKLHFQEKKLAIVRNREEFMKIINAVDIVLNDIEMELSNNNYDWLCSNDFTIADISLGMLLHRLYCLGFENYCWKNCKRPFIEKFFNKLSERPSFQKSLPTTLATIKTVWSKTPAVYKFGMGAISAAVLVTSLIAQKH